MDPSNPERGGALVGGRLTVSMPGCGSVSPRHFIPYSVTFFILFYSDYDYSGILSLR